MSEEHKCGGKFPTDGPFPTPPVHTRTNEKQQEHKRTSRGRAGHQPGLSSKPDIDTRAHGSQTAPGTEGPAAQERARGPRLRSLAPRRRAPPCRPLLGPEPEPERPPLSCLHPRDDSPLAGRHSHPAAATTRGRRPALPAPLFLPLLRLGPLAAARARARLPVGRGRGAREERRHVRGAPGPESRRVEGTGREQWRAAHGKGYTLRRCPISWMRLAACWRYESSMSASTPQRRLGVFSSCSRVKNQREEAPRPDAMTLPPRPPPSPPGSRTPSQGRAAPPRSARPGPRAAPFHPRRRRARAQGPSYRLALVVCFLSFPAPAAPGVQTHNAPRRLSFRDTGSGGRQKGKVGAMHAGSRIGGVKGRGGGYGKRLP